MSNVRDFGATGDGKTDDTQAIQHAVTQGDGLIELPRGDYLITSPIAVPLDQVGRTSLQGFGGTAKVIMAGPGPAFHFVGTHGGTADPNSAKPNVWSKQRLPTMLNVEIEGRHEQADGIRIEGTFQATFEGLLLRQLRNCIHLTKRNRNVVISHCHMYHNTGVGVFMDGVNLHQININNNHISYCRNGGIRIERSEVRNLQITGNDIEYNNFRAHKTEPTPTAEIWIDCTAPKASVREGTIVSNTIQATPSPSGANIRLIGKREGETMGLWTISDNLIGNQETNIHMSGCRSVAISGNVIYTAYKHNILAEQCANLTVTGNNLDQYHNTTLGMHLRFNACDGVVFSGNLIHDRMGSEKYQSAVPDRQATVEFIDSKRLTMTGCQIADPAPVGLAIVNCERLNVSSNMISDARKENRMTSAILIDGQTKHAVIHSNSLDRGSQVDIEIKGGSDITKANNLIVESQ